MVKKAKETGKNMQNFPHNRPERIWIDFWKTRNFENKIMYSIYKFVRVIHVSIWFYFLPFLMLIFNYAQTWFIEQPGEREVQQF